MFELHLKFSQTSGKKNIRNIVFLTIVEDLAIDNWQPMHVVNCKMVVGFLFWILNTNWFTGDSMVGFCHSLLHQ